MQRTYFVFLVDRKTEVKYTVFIQTIHINENENIIRIFFSFFLGTFCVLRKQIT